MNIVVTAHSIATGTGGARTGILGICKGLAARGHSVTLITMTAGEQDPHKLLTSTSYDSSGLKVRYFPVSLILFGNAFSWALFPALKREISKADIVLIHSLYQFISTTAAHVCRKFGVPYVLRPHGTLDPVLVFRRRWPMKWVYINLFEKMNFERAAAIQYSSETESAMTRRFIRVDTPGLIIPEGVDLAPFEISRTKGLFRKRFGIPPEKRVLLFLGRFHQKKGIELLIEAFARIAHERSDVHLVLAGSGERAYFEKIEKRAEALACKRQISITGELDEELKYGALLDADLFVLPSYGENFGIAVVEAMASGLPVVISDKVGIFKEIEEAGAGLIASCEVESIVGQIKALLDDTSLRARMGKEGLALVKRKFDARRMAEELEKAFQKICNNHYHTAKFASHGI